MTSVIVIGHGNYATGIESALLVLMGEFEGFEYIDFVKDDDLATLTAKIELAAKKCPEDILFSCDLAGGSPFRQSAVLCMNKPNWHAVAGLNMAAHAEIVHNLNLPVAELLDLAVEVAQNTIMQFPEKEV